MTTLTENEIELRVERAMDKLDTLLMNNKLSQSDYDHQVSLLDKWAQAQYDVIPRDYVG
jgi:hypothetical protein